MRVWSRAVLTSLRLSLPWPLGLVALLGVPWILARGYESAGFPLIRLGKTIPLVVDMLAIVVGAPLLQRDREVGASEIAAACRFAPLVGGLGRLGIASLAVAVLSCALFVSVRAVGLTLPWHYLPLVWLPASLGLLAVSAVVSRAAHSAGEGGGATFVAWMLLLYIGTGTGSSLVAGVSPAARMLPLDLAGYRWGGIVWCTVWLMGMVAAWRLVRRA